MMFWHVFSYRLKCLLRDRITVFWTLIFPLIMATLFHFAFGHLTSSSEGFEPIKTVIVDNEAYRDASQFQNVVKSLAESGKDQFLELTIAPLEQAERLLEAGAVIGIISVDNDMELIVKQRGLKQTILKAFLDEYSQTMNTVTEIVSKNPEALRELTGAIRNRISFTEQISFSSADPNINLGFFYALIAMACLYSSYWGIRNTIDVQADQSPQGARRSSAPTHKARIVLSDTLAALIIGFSEVLLLLAYMRFVLGVEFGHQIGFILLLTLAGCMAGVAFGNFVGTIVRRDENLKYGVLLIGNMTMSFLAGLMFANLKDIIAQKVPILAYLNPAALIADSFYSLYIYDTFHRFWINIAFLCLITTILSFASFLYLRGERYASI